jgi:hypothetical protein
MIPGPEGVIETGESGGRLYCPLINVAFQLRDVSRADGGFCIVPGAHKSCLGPGAWPGPGPEFTMEGRQGIGLSIDLGANRHGLHSHSDAA